MAKIIRQTSGLTLSIFSRAFLQSAAVGPVRDPVQVGTARGLSWGIAMPATARNNTFVLTIVVHSFEGNQVLSHLERGEGQHPKT